MITKAFTYDTAETAHLRFEGGELDDMTEQLRKMADFARRINDAEAALPGDRYNDDDICTSVREDERAAVPADRADLLSAAAGEKDGFIRIEGRTV